MIRIDMEKRRKKIEKKIKSVKEHEEKINKINELLDEIIKIINSIDDDDVKTATLNVVFSRLIGRSELSYTQKVNAWWRATLEVIAMGLYIMGLEGKEEGKEKDSEVEYI